MLFRSVAVEAYHVDNVIHAVQPNWVTRQHEHLTKVAVTECASLLEVPLPLGKLLFEGERDQLEQVHSFLEEHGWAQEYELIFSSRELLEMTAKGAHKGGMVLRLAQRLGIDAQHVYCVGDEANDLSMLRIAREGFIPANASEAVKSCGATMVRHAREDAIADVISRLEQRYNG